MTLSKLTLSRLYAATPKVALTNGVFNVVSVKAEFSRHCFELRVKVTHPCLERYAGANPQEVEFYRWESYNGTPVDLPAELLPLVETMKLAGTMSDDAASKLKDSLLHAVSESCHAMGMSAAAFL